MTERPFDRNQCAGCLDYESAVLQLKQRVKELEAELEKWRGQLCGGVPEYRELGTTGMITDRRGDVWKKA